MSRRGLALAAVLVVLALAIGWLGGPPRNEGAPLDPRSDSPLGASAVVEVAQQLGATVEIAARPPSDGDDVALMLVDFLDEAATAATERWLRAGGTLVVTDPGSHFAPRPVDPGPLGNVIQGSVGRGRCDVVALDGADRFDPAGGVAWERVGADRGCFGTDDRAHVLVRPVDAGHIVAVGGAGAFTNTVLGEHDNGVVAAAFLAPSPGTRLLVVEGPAPGAGERTLADLIAPNVERALLQLVVAFVLYALWRARRLGRPVPEPQPVQLAGSELVRARGELLQQARTPAHAAALLRADLRHELERRLGIPADLAPDELADALIARLDVDVATIRGAVGAQPVTSDSELVTVARSLEAIRQEVLHGHAPTRPSAP